MHALLNTSLTHVLCGNCATASAQFDELVALAGQKSAAQWKAQGMLMRGCVFAAVGTFSDAVPIITSGLTALRSTGSTNYMPWYLLHRGIAYAGLHRFDDASRWVGEAMMAMETSQERWCEAEVHRIAGEIAQMSPERDTAKAEACFEHALAVARQQAS